MIPLKTQAIQTALSGNWNQAITLNLELLDENPDDVDTLNRLAFAYALIGKIKEARSTYQKVLVVDEQNPIATKNLKRLRGTTAGDNQSNKDSGLTASTPHTTILNNMFLEESGKTKVIELVNVAEGKTIIHLRTGEFLQLQIKRSKVFVLDNDKQYIGVIPDDIGRRLIKFMDGGNKYEAYVKSIEEHRLTIFVKETVRAKRFKNQPSFVSNKTKMQLDNQTKNYRLKTPLVEDAEEPSEE